MDNHINRVYRSNIPPEKPYSYITASLDLTGAKNGQTLYFNLDNNFDYLKDRDYSRYIIFTEKNIIDEVVVWADPLVVATQVSPNGPFFNIGGATNLNSAVSVFYAAPVGYGPKVPPDYSGAPLDIFNLNAKSINYFGHSAAKIPYQSTPENYRYLAITLVKTDIPVGQVLIESGVVRIQIRVFSK